MSSFISQNAGKLEFAASVPHHLCLRLLRVCPRRRFHTQRSAEADVNEDRALMRFELIEALLRVAVTMRDNEGEEEISPADKVLLAVWIVCVKCSCAAQT